MRKLVGDCAVDDCEKPRRRKDWCVAHYKRWWKYGDAAAGAPLRVRGTLEERFWAYVLKSDGCWEWQATTQNKGYGVLTSRVAGRVVSHTAHRVSWELHFGPIPDDMLVLHRCDNPPCVRPEHLFLGTQADNMADMWAKGRRDRHSFLPRNA